MLKILLFAALAIGIAGPAHADPVSAIAAWVGSTLSVGAATALAITNLAIGIGAKILGVALGQAAMGDQKVNVQLDVDLGDDTPLSFIVGDNPTAGKRKYAGSWGKNTRYITEVIEVSCLPVTGLKAAWFNDERGDIRTDQPALHNGHLMGYPVKNFSEDVGTSRERDRCWIKLINGDQTAADAFLMSVFGTDPDYPWTSDMIGTGKAYAVVTYYYDPEVMTGSTEVLIQPQPLPMYDLRKDASTGGVGAHRWGDRATYEPSSNAAVIAYNVARGIYFGDEWVFGGQNLAAWRLPRAEWVAAMNDCDRAVSLEGGGTEPAYRAGMQITTDMRPVEVLREIGRAANMRFAEIGGLLKPIVDLPGAAVLAFSEADIVITEAQSYKPFNGLSEVYNALSATYPEPGEKWATKDAPEYIDAEFTELDGGRYLPTSIAYHAVPYAQQVQRLMRAQMRDYRRERVLTCCLPPEAYGLEPLVDMVSITRPRSGFSNKLFVVETVSKTPGMNVMVTVREVDPGDYDWSSDFEMPVTIVPPAPVRPWVQPINGFAVVPVAIQGNDTRPRRAAIMARCDGDEVGVTAIRLQLRLQGATEALADVTRPFSEPWQWLLQDVLPMTAYQVRAQLLSDLTPRSEWTAWHSVTTFDLRLGRDDIAAEIIADLDELVTWSGQTSAELQAVRDDLEAEATRVDGIVQDVRGELASDVAQLEGQIAATLTSARGYADTAIEAQDLIIQGQFSAVAGQIEQLTAALTSDNLVSNGSFASSATPWTLANSTRFEKAGQTDALILACPEDAMVGIGIGATGSISQSLNAFEVTSDDRLQVRFAATSTAATRTLACEFTWRDALGAAIGTPVTHNVTVSPANQWRVYSLQIDPPDNAVGADLKITKIQSGTRALITAIEASTVNIAIEARITDLEAARVTDQQALATYKTQVDVRFADADAALVTESTTRADADQALGNRVTTVEAGFAGQQASIGQIETTLADAESSIAQVDSRIEATYARSQMVRDPEFRDRFRHWQGSDLAETRLVDRNAAHAHPIYHAMPGARALLIVPTDDASFALYAGRYDVSASDVLVLKVAIFQQPGAPTGRVWVQFFDASGEYLGDGPSITGNGPGWQVLTTPEFRPPEGAREARVIIAKGPVAGTANGVFITSITLERQTGYEALTSAAISEVRQTQATADLAFASYVSNMASTVNALDGRVTTNANNIAARYTKAQTDSAISAAVNQVTASLQPQINQRATTTALNALTARVDTAEGQITAMSNSITQTSAEVGKVSASGLFRIFSTATGTGAKTRIVLRADATANNDNSQYAAMFIEAGTDDRNSVSFVANRFAIVNDVSPNSPKTVPFFVQGGTAYLDKAVIRDGDIDDAKIGNVIQSRNYASGEAGSGWRIGKDGTAEFTNVIIRRQLEVASGTLNVGNFAASELSEGKTSFLITDQVKYQRVIWATPIPITAWSGARRTYIATAGMAGTVTRYSSVDETYWGWHAEVLPLTRWNGNQSLRLMLTFYGQNVGTVRDCVVTWKIYEVS